MKRSARGSLLLATAAAASALAVDFAAADTITWVGGGSTNRLENAENWDSNPTAPGPSDIAVFPSLSSALASSPTADLGISVLGIVIDNSGFAWTIDRSGTGTNPRSVTVGTSGFDIGGSGTVNWNPVVLSLNGGQTWNVAAGVTFSMNSGASVTGTGPVTLTGGGTVILPNAANSNSGGYEVVNGVLGNSRSSGGLGSGGVTLQTGGTYELRGGGIGGQITVAGGGTVRGSGGATGIASGSNINFTSNGTNVNVSAGTSGSDTLLVAGVVLGGDTTNTVTVGGNGIITLQGGTNSASAFQGKWILESGTLRAYDIFSLGNRGGAASTTNVANPSSIQLAGGTLSAAGTNSSSTAVNFNNPVSVSASSTILIDKLSSAGTAVSGVSKRFGALTIGASTLTIGLSSLVTGPTTAGSSTRVGFTTGTLTDNATFNVTGTTGTVGLEFSGALSGSGFGFTKTGGGFMNLVAANSYTGGTTVAGGQLNFVTTAGITSTSTLEVQNGSTISFSGGIASPNWTLTGTSLNGTGLIRAHGNTNATITMRGLTISPGTATTSGQLTLQSLASTGKGVAFAANGSTLTTMSMNVSGSGYVAGTDYDQLVIEAATAMSGNLGNTRLVLNIDDSLTPGDFDGTEMMLINAPAVNFAGMSFASVTITAGWDAYDQINYNNGSVTLQLPEPGSLTLLGLAGLVLVRRRRRG